MLCLSFSSLTPVDTSSLVLFRWKDTTTNATSKAATTTLLPDLVRVQLPGLDKIKAVPTLFPFASKPTERKLQVVFQAPSAGNVSITGTTTRWSTWVAPAASRSARLSSVKSELSVSRLLLATLPSASTTNPARRRIRVAQSKNVCVLQTVVFKLVLTLLATSVSNA